ncbi:uncharacterized protein LOC135940966 [Cloeon dipterum]|uniref:uncharacterized protein LOC135940966 n=1 Tax=Cloeon dipterum TaxID=197152 RepID=UPI00321FFCAC
MAPLSNIEEHRGKPYLHPRKQPRFRNWDKNVSGVELRHLRSQSLSDEQVIQVSRTEWLLSSEEEGKVYAVERVLQDDEALIDAHNASCEFWGVDDVYNVNEGYCRSCFICCHAYNCDCRDEHPICKHIHKVHAYNEKKLDEQRPHDVQKTIEKDFEILQQIKECIKEEDKIHFCLFVSDFVRKLQENFNLK